MTTTSAAPAIPAEFICPITMELMVYPMATKHGANFERDAIVSWLARGNRHCPLTRTPPKIGELIHNNYLTAQIQAWCQQHGVEQDKRNDDAGSNESIREQLWCDDYLKHTYGTVEPRFKAVTLAPYCFDGTESTCQRHKHGISNPRSHLTTEDNDPIADDDRSIEN